MVRPVAVAQTQTISTGATRVQMKHLMKYLTGPLAFAAVVLLLGEPASADPQSWEGVPACGATYMNAGGNPVMDTDCDGTPNNVDPCPLDPSNTCKGDDVTCSEVAGILSLYVGGIALAFAPWVVISVPFAIACHGHRVLRHVRMRGVGVNNEGEDTLAEKLWYPSKINGYHITGVLVAVVSFVVVLGVTQGWW